VDLSVRFKPLGGQKDQAAGLVLRYGDSNNYYVVRANALENNVVFYKFVNGKRTDLKPVGAGDDAYGKKAAVPREQWSTLRVLARGSTFEVFLNGEKLFVVQDRTFAAAGKIGLWTKADSVTAFDDLTFSKISQEPVFVGYVFRPPADIDYKLYTHLCHAFVTLDGNGSIKTNAHVPSRKLVQEAHHAGVKVLLSLGGWGWDEQFAAMTRNPGAEDRFVKAVLGLVETFDYDGIDLDWEYPDTAEEVAGFGRLARRFRGALDALASAKQREMLQTIAVSSHPGTLKWLSNELLLSTMDWVNVMTYDMAGDWTDYAGHHAPLHASPRQPGQPNSCEATIQHLLDRGMPPERLALGIPLYGRGFAGAEPYGPAKKPAPGARQPGGNYNRLVALQNEHGWKKIRDEQTKVPWLIGPDGNGVIGFDDPESVALKTRWAMSLELRGVFFWEIAADRLPDGSNPLQKASRTALDEPFAKDSQEE
jgi:chitinase